MGSHPSATLIFGYVLVAPDDYEEEEDEDGEVVAHHTPGLYGIYADIDRDWESPHNTFGREPSPIVVDSLHHGDYEPPTLLVGLRSTYHDVSCGPEVILLPVDGPVALADALVAALEAHGLPVPPGAPAWHLASEYG